MKGFESRTITNFKLFLESYMGYVKTLLNCLSIVVSGRVIVGDEIRRVCNKAVLVYFRELYENLTTEGNHLS